jgi:drug/metabolite transporter (DMT)-like permease
MEGWQLAVVGLVFFVTSTWTARDYWRDGEHGSAAAILAVGWTMGILICVFPFVIPLVWPDAKDSPIFQWLAIIVLVVFAVGGLSIFVLLWKKLKGLLSGKAE